MGGHWRHGAKVSQRMLGHATELVSVAHMAQAAGAFAASSFSCVLSLMNLVASHPHERGRSPGILHRDEPGLGHR